MSLPFGRASSVSRHQPEAVMLRSMPVITFVPCTKPELARPFYEGVLGLRFVVEDQFAVVFSAENVMVRVVNVASVAGHAPAQFTGSRIRSRMCCQ